MDAAAQRVAGTEQLVHWSRQAVTVIDLDGVDRLVIGRHTSCELVVDDAQVSRRHAVLERVAGGWTAADLGSRNGTTLNDSPLLTSAPIYDTDVIGIGDSRFGIRGTERRSDSPTKVGPAPPSLTRRERDVLVALVGPTRTGDVLRDPASTREMAASLYVSEAAVKQHLGRLFDKFGIVDGDRRRVRLANEALRRGAIRLTDLQIAPSQS